MRSRIISILLTAFVSFPALLHAQKKEDFKQPRILILLDGSSSMVNEWNAGKTRFTAAGEIITNLIDSIYKLNNQVEFSLRVYGHEHDVPENNCFDTKREVMFSKDNLTQMELRLASLHPRGVSPIAYSLKTAAENDFINERDYAYSLVLITDGGESCGGNICDVVQTLLAKKIEFRPYIISLVDYAPLKDQFACLGAFLTVATPGEMAPAINTIAETYRKLFAIPIAKPKPEERPQTTKPSMPRMEVPVVTVPPKETEPEKTTTAPASAPPSTVPEPRRNSRIQVDTVPYVRQNIAALRPHWSARIANVFWSLRTEPLKKVPALKIPPREADTVITRIVAPPKPKPATPAQRPPARPKEDKIAQYTMTKEASAKTTLQVYFTNGKGKFYATSPRLRLVDPKTNNVVQRFFRTVDASGTPDPKDIPAGNYDVRFENNPELVSKNITITPENNHKLVIVVNNAGLQFRYETDHKRPVSEYVATVKRLFDNSPVISQPCETIREYEPGNYHIEIPGILPPFRRNLDLEFDKIFTIDIEEDGFLQVTNSNVLGKVALYYQLGDQMVPFYTLNVDGVSSNQKLHLQPGPYEARYRGKVKYFVVKSKETTQVELE